MSVSCSRSLVSLSIGRASADKSQSQLPKLCLRLASSRVMIFGGNKRVQIKGQQQMCVCVRVCSVRPLYHTHLPATRGRVTKEVVDHVQLILLHNHKALFPSLLSVHIWRPLDEKRVQMVHSGTNTHRTLEKGCLFVLEHAGWSCSSAHLSCGIANQYSGCLPRPLKEWMGLEVSPEVKDFLMGFPTLKHRNMGGFLLFSSDE